MKSLKTLTLSIIVFSTILNSYAQRPNVGRTKFRVCKHANGSNCASAPISCGWEYTDNDKDGNSQDPFDLYDYWYPNPSAPPAYLKATCCSAEGMVNPGNSNDGLISYFGMKLYLGVHDYKLYAHCDNGGGYEDPIWDFTGIIDTSWLGVVVNTYIDNLTSNLVIETWNVSENYPWYVSASRRFVSIPQASILSHCSETITTTGVDKIFKTAKVTTNFSPNPIKSEVGLNFIIKNGEALNDSLRFDFYNSIGQLTYQYVPSATEAKIDISSMPSGIYFIVVASKYARETYTISIQ